VRILGARPGAYGAGGSILAYNNMGCMLSYSNIGWGAQCGACSAGGSILAYNSIGCVQVLCAVPLLGVFGDHREDPIPLMTVGTVVRILLRQSNRRTVSTVSL
jgi:hypothetical protein